MTQAIASGSKLKKSFSVFSKSKSSGRKEMDEGSTKHGLGKMMSRAPRPQVNDSEDDDEGDDFDAEDGDEPDENAEEVTDAESDEEMGTDEEISRVKSARTTKKGTKRKPLTTAETFGSTLTSLLSDPLPTFARSIKKAKTSSHPLPSGDPATALLGRLDSRAISITSSSKPVKPLPQAILSLSHAKPPPSKSALSHERKAARALKAEKEEKEDKARIRDVVEGWVNEDGSGGMEFEKGLRKVAQKGVVKLFNAILVASKTAEANGKSLADKAGVKAERGRKREKDNVLGRGATAEEGQALTSESFLDLVRMG